MNNTEIRKQLEKQLQMLSELSEKGGLTVDERLRTASTINTLATTLVSPFSLLSDDQTETDSPQ